MADEIKSIPHRFRDAMRQSTRLLEESNYQQALQLLNDAIEDVAQHENAQYACTLCHHAAVLAYFMGDCELQKVYYERSLAADPENPRALYGLAKLAQERGDLKTADDLAVRCHAALMRSEIITKEALLEMLFERWPGLAEDPLQGRPPSQ